MMRAGCVRAAVVVLGVALGTTRAAGDTLFLEGRMTSRVTVEVVERYEPGAGTQWISVRSFRTPSFSSPTWRQRVIADEVSYSIAPTSALEGRSEDNVDFTARWERPVAPIQITRKLVVDMEAALAPVPSQAPFPLGPVPAGVQRFLRATPMTQRDDPRIGALARRLTAGARTERQAVSLLLNHVVDSLQYQYDPPAHDAAASLERGIANCQGYSHLSLALLRAAGIPGRIAVGISLSKAWRVQHTDGTVTFKMGKGRHAWIEVYYPDLGWVPYDPQTSHLFVSLYHVRQAVGLDVTDTLSYIQASPALPRMSETIEGDGANETFSVTTVNQVRTPRNFLVSPSVRDAVVVVAPPPPPVPVTPPSPPPVPPPPVPVTPPRPVPPPPVAVPPPIDRRTLTKAVDFGNMEFPASLRIFGSRGVSGGVVQAAHTFIVETADYATGPEELAQAFRVDEPMVLTDLSLALQKFGGQRGDLWLELHEDAARRPGAPLGASRRIPVGALLDRGGYRWVVFRFAPESGGVVLAPGRYWAVLRASGDGIFNWYFSLGNAYGDPDDTRSRPRGTSAWSNILNYRFNFRVAGLVKP
jgi:transglutaminase-like putative cysteine protease